VSDRPRPSEEEMCAAAAMIRRGGLVAFPTETVYGLGANALDAEAVARIYAAKERPFASPLIVHVADETMARSIAAEWPAQAQLLAQKFWPGPLTLIVKKSALVPDLATAGLDSVGLRMPNHPVALDLIRRAGVPIAAPSANRFTQISPTTAAHVRAGLGGRIDLILDGGPTQVGIESTVASLRRHPPAVLRPGMITQTELEAATGIAWEREVDIPHIGEAPGLYPKHYSPKTPFYLLTPGAPTPAGRGQVLEMPASPAEYAAMLYAQLHKADGEGWDWIALPRPPDAPQWAGILDRLTRAARR
jgi:L-threonylcarbamoyladenylate synthase